jgi:hypothetical protein
VLADKGGKATPGLDPGAAHSAISLRTQATHMNPG